MEKENSSYYNYDDGEQSFYDEDEDLDNFSTSYEDHFDFIVDSLQNFGSKHEITDIEDFLCDYGDLTLKEWSKDLTDPSIFSFTCNYIEQLLNDKFITPSIYKKTTGNSTSLHKNEKQKVPADDKSV